MNGGNQGGDLEARLRNLIVSNSNTTNAAVDAFPALPPKLDENKRGNAQPRETHTQQQNGPGSHLPRQDMPPHSVAQVGSPHHSQVKQNGQRNQAATPQRRPPQKYRKFDDWQHGQPASPGPVGAQQSPRTPLTATRGAPKVLQNASPQRQPGAGPNRPQQRGMHNATAATPSRFQPLQRPNQHAFNQAFTTQCQYLELQAQRLLPQVEMTAEESAIKDSFRMHLERLIQEALRIQLDTDAPTISLACFGSLASGFGMPGSDMDLALQSSTMPAELPRIIEKIVLDMGHGAHLLTRTRVPIIKICESPSAELYQALCEERQKWDDMTPEERERHDRGVKHEESVESAVKTGLQAGDGASGGNDVKNDPQPENAPEGTLQTDFPARVQPPQTAMAENATEPRTPSNGMSASSNSPKSSETQPSDDQPLSITTQDSASTSDEATPLTTTTTNSTTTTSIIDTTTTSTTTNPATPTKTTTPQKRRPWLRERKLGPLDFPKSGVGIQCDINFSNALGLHNTTLLRCYSRCDIRVRLMILFIKSWASRRKINSARNGTLSSYGYVLMVLHYLVNIAQPPVCPNLQLAAAAARQQHNSPPLEIDGHTVHFWRNEAEIDALAAKGMLTHNRQPLGVLLQGFFHYFAHQAHDSPLGGFVWTKEVLSLRTPGGLQTKEQKGWTGAKNITVHDVQVTNRYLFAIEDPFELDHNVARTVTHPGIVAIRDEFRRAWRILQFVGRCGVEALEHEDELMEVVVEEEWDPEGKGKENENGGGKKQPEVESETTTVTTTGNGNGDDTTHTPQASTG